MKTQLLALLVLAAPLRAQDSVIVIDPDAAAADTTDRQGLPEELIRRLLAVYNDSTTTRFWGDVDITRESRLTGNVAVYRGSVRLGGKLEGSLTLINGSLLLLPGAEITGDVLVVGGNVALGEGTRIGGRKEVYWDAAPVVRSPTGELVRRERRRLPELTTARRSFQAGPLHATLVIGSDGTYNRVEGLPIVFGPTLDMKLGGKLSARVDARGILRTAGDNDLLREDFGYSGRLELRYGGSRGAGIGGRVYSIVNGIEHRPFTRSEVGWSAFLFQRDEWDYFQRKGVGTYVFAYPFRAFRLELGVRRDKESSVRANDPWSLFRNSDRWRPNPLIDDGHYVTADFSAELDTRNSDEAPATGWWIRASFERNWGDDDVAPINLPTSVRSPIPTDGHYEFNRVEIDLRRYNQLASNLKLAGRILAAGYAGGDPLPVQRRVSLGGPDLLPGQAFRSFACAPQGVNDAALPALCDRMIAAQLELRSRLDLGLGYRYRDRFRHDVDRFIGIDQADLVVFVDAGKSWLSGDGPGRVPNDRIPSFKEWKADIGVGLDAGGIGVYLARALTDGQPVRISLRLSRRF
ncbi:MAG: hypothetical protein ABI836_12855 [Gemmatimonadota bacterium]